MGMFDFITENETFKKMMLKQLQKVFDDGHVSCIVVTKNEKTDSLDLLILEPGDMVKSDAKEDEIEAFYGKTAKVVLLTQRLPNANNINTDGQITIGNGEPK